MAAARTLCFVDVLVENKDTEEPEALATLTKS